MICVIRMKGGYWADICAHELLRRSLSLSRKNFMLNRSRFFLAIAAPVITPLSASTETTPQRQRTDVFDYRF